MKKFICLFLSLFLFLSSVSAVEYTAEFEQTIRVGDEIFPNNLFMGVSVDFDDVVLLLWSNVYKRPYQVEYKGIIDWDYYTDEETGEEIEITKYQKLEFTTPQYSRGVAVLGFEITDIDTEANTIDLYYSVSKY